MTGFEIVTYAVIYYTIITGLLIFRIKLRNAEPQQEESPYTSAYLAACSPDPWSFMCHFGSEMGFVTNVKEVEG